MCIHKTADEKYPDDWLIAEKFWSDFTIHYPVRPRERICEWQWGDTTDAGRSRESDNITNVVRPNFIHTHIHTI